MRQLVLTLILLAGFVIASAATAGDLIISRSVLEDKSGSLTITDVVGRQFTPIGPTLSKGFTGSAHWLRLQVRAPAKGSRAVLFIRQSFLNEIRLYEPAVGSPSGWNSRVTGNFYPYNERDRAKKTLGFIVNVTSAETTYYLRIKTSTQLQIRAELLDPDEAEQKDHQLDLLEVFFATSMFLLLLWALHSYLLDRQPVSGLFAIHQAVYILFGIAVTGYLAPYLPDGCPRLANLATAIPYCTVSFTTLLFCRELFRPYQPPPLMARGLDLFLLAFPLQLAAIALGYTPVAVIFNAVLVKISWWYFVIMTFTLRREQSPSRRVLQLLFAIITLIFTFFWYISSIKDGSIDNLGRLILVVNGIMIGSIFALILNARSRRLLQEAQQSSLELKAKSEFLALVSHEIRTPISALIGFSTLARKTTDPTKLDHYLEIMEQSSSTLMSLVNNILDMSKIEFGRMRLEKSTLNLHRLVQNLAEQHTALFIQKKLEFRLDVAENVPVWISADAVQLRQILVNLLANAIKFTEQGVVSCIVTIPSAVPEADLVTVRFEIRDTGIGMPESAQSQLYRPFNQLDPTISRRYGGTGLGLAIVHNLVQMMEGSISVQSREGEGSCFIVEMPFHVTDPAPDEIVLPEFRASGLFLVVEDNMFNRCLLEDILTSWGGQVTVAEDGSKALHLIEQQQFDLILLDIRMPDIDGIEVANRIRRRERERSEISVPIIAITADTDAATRDACLAVGINSVLAKPVITVHLQAAIAALFSGTAEPPRSTGLRLNIQTSNDLGSNSERACEYREMLRMDIEEELRSLHDALVRGDRTDLGRAAHALKGLCCNLESSEPYEMAVWLHHNAPTAADEKMHHTIEQLQTTLSYRYNVKIKENTI